MKTDNYYLKSGPGGYGFFFTQGNGKRYSMVFETKLQGMRILREMFQTGHLSREDAYSLLLDVQLEEKIHLSNNAFLTVEQKIISDMATLFHLERFEIELLSGLKERPFRKNPTLCIVGNQARIVGKTFITPLFSTKVYGFMFLAVYKKNGMVPQELSVSIEERLRKMKMDEFPEAVIACMN